MKKTLLILSFILLSVVSFAQRQRTTAMFDADTTTRPKAGFYGIGVRANNVYFVPPTGNNIRLANYSLFTGLTTNYLPKWNGSKLVNSLVLDNGTNLGISISSPEHKLHINGGLYASGLTAPQSASTSGYSIGATGGLPYSYMKITSAATDTKIWDHYTDGVNLYYRILNDANTIGTTWLRVNRTTTTVNGVYFPNGNVGIGTTSPAAKLDVNGNINSNGAYSIAGNPIFQRNTSFWNYVYDWSNGVALQLGGLDDPSNYYNNEFHVFRNRAGSEFARITNEGRVGVGTTTPLASAILDITSTTLGVLLPRLTTTQINAIASPANGLVVYNTTLNKLCVYENGTWKQVTTTNM